MSANIEKWPVTPVSEAELREGKVLFVEDKPRARYAWDTGVAIGRYLEELKAGRIIGRKCGHCRRVVVPPRMFCEWCFRPNDEWVYLSDRGTVNTFSLCYITWDMVRLKEPLIPAVIEIEGASKGVGFLHLLGEVDVTKVAVGMKVKAVWRSPEERIGAITDIRYFRPE